MTENQKLAAIAGVAALATAGACYFSGKSSNESLTCGAGVGLLAGTVAFLARRAQAQEALPNRVSKEAIEHGYGALTPPVLRLLSKVNSTELYAPRQIGGWVIGDVPANEYEVRQLP